uniref:Uncharacterized protein n=1 Tax=Leersia perrieri TaxID=77586 RepID=A0A0D9Y0J8_9ORYZ
MVREEVHKSWRRRPRRRVGKLRTSSLSKRTPYLAHQLSMRVLDTQGSGGPPFRFGTGVRCTKA